MKVSSVEDLKNFFTSKSPARQIKVLADDNCKIVLGEGDNLSVVDYAQTKLCHWDEAVSILKAIDPSLYNGDKVCLDSNSTHFSSFGMITDAGNFYLFDKDYDLSVNFKNTALNCFALFDSNDTDSSSAIIFINMYKENTWSVSVVQGVEKSKFYDSLDFNIQAA
jgi:hypothetical protein